VLNEHLAKQCPIQRINLTFEINALFLHFMPLDYYARQLHKKLAALVRLQMYSCIDSSSHSVAAASDRTAAENVMM